MANALVSMQDQFRGLASLPAERQIGLVVSIAAGLTLVVSLFLWLSRPNFVTLYPNLSERESGLVVEALNRHDIRYRIDTRSGVVQVPAAQLHEARLQLATEGLPRASGFGFELLEEDMGLGTSRLVEDARHHRAIEGELARSIATLDVVESARVHLALPRQTVFVRERGRPTASVLLNLYAGRTLDEGRVAGIVHLVSSSIPDLDPENVTVVDQRGRLLTSSDQGVDGMGGSGQQLDFTRRLEEGYVRRILDIISPIVGADAVRAQVTADVDFARVERTVESFDPAATTVRSEQVTEERSRGFSGMGIPGALSNQPPDGGVLLGDDGLGPPDRTGLDPDADWAWAEGFPGSLNRRSVRNFEVDRTISHVREAPGNLRRLSVAVVVDHRDQVNEEGVVERVPLSEAEVEGLTALVREAVGFNADRGDSVNLINASFRPVDPPAPMPEPPLWEEAWVVDLAKTALAVIMVLLIALLVVRPLLRTLAQRGVAARREQQLALPGGYDGMDDEEARVTVGPSSRGALPGPTTGMGAATDTGFGAGAGSAAAPGAYETNLETARTMARENPKRVAQVMKTWIASDGANS